MSKLYLFWSSKCETEYDTRLKFRARRKRSKILRQKVKRKIYNLIYIFLLAKP